MPPLDALAQLAYDHPTVPAQRPGQGPPYTLSPGNGWYCNLCWKWWNAHTHEGAGLQDTHQRQSGRGPGAETPTENQPPDPGRTGVGVYPWGPQKVAVRTSSMSQNTRQAII
jgi:hypothetical protein